MTRVSDLGFRCSLLTAATIVYCGLTAADASAQTTSPAAAVTSAPTSASSATDCGKTLDKGTVKLGGLTNDTACTIITEAIKGTAQADVGSGGTTLNYTVEDKTFYRALGKSIRKHGGKDKITVNMATKDSPVVTVGSLRAESAPAYNELGLGVWVDRIENAGGQYCVAPTENGPPALVIMALEFLAKYAIPWVLDKYHLQQAYKKAVLMDVHVFIQNSGAAKGRVTRIEFIKRGSEPCASQKPAP